MIESQEAPSTPESKPAAPSVARAAAILSILATLDQGITLSDLARRVKAPKTSVLSICTTLVDVGFLVRESDRYRLGLEAVKLGRNYTVSSDAASEFWRVHEELRVLPDETMVLSALDGPNVVYLACRKGAKPMAMMYDVGSSLPAHCTGSGKAMLARASRAELEERFGKGQIAGGTARSVASVSALRRETAKARERGYAVDDGEAVPGMRCYGVALFNQSDQPVCAVSLTVVAAGRTPAEYLTILEHVHAFATRLAQRLGLPAPAPLVTDDWTDADLA